MRKIFAFVAAAVVVFAAFSSGAFAADSLPSVELSLDDCIRIALVKQSDVLVGQNSVRSYEQRRIEALGGYYPQISASRTGAETQTNYMTDGWDNSGSVTVTQNVYDGGLRESRVRGASASLRAGRYSLERTRQSVVYNVTKNYFSLLRAIRLADVQTAKVKYLEGQKAMVMERAKLGDAAQVDVLPVEAQLAAAHVDMLSADNAVQTAAVQLQNEMGLSPSDGFRVADIDGPDRDVLSLDEYMAKALKARPEIMQAGASVDSARESVTTARISMYPRPFVDGQYEQTLVGASRRDAMVRGGLTFDLFDGGKNRASYKDAKMGLSSAEIKAAQAARDVEADVRIAYLNLMNAKARIDASALSLAAAQKNYEVQESRYKQGLAIPLDLLNAQLQLVTAQSSAVQAQYDYYTAYAQMDYAVGAAGGNNEKK